MLGLDDHGDFALYNDADDRVIWDRATGGMKHVATGKVVSVIINENTCTLPVDSDEVIFTISHGPEKLPSVYLEHLKREGWVCVTCILTPEVLEGLERVAGTDRYEHLEMINDIPKLCQDVAVQGCHRACIPLADQAIYADPGITPRTSGRLQSQ